MGTQNGGVQEIQQFIEKWTGEEQPFRDRFVSFFELLKSLQDVELHFVARPGVSYSMRPKHKKQAGRELFAMVDVIDDSPEERWLSVCFYGDLITDPEERGELIPGGLAGDDGYCFDMFDDDEEMAGYLMERLREASQNAAG